jgi:hypothetical protein
MWKCLVGELCRFETGVDGMAMTLASLRRLEMAMRPDERTYLFHLDVINDDLFQTAAML